MTGARTPLSALAQRWRALGVALWCALLVGAASVAQADTLLEDGVVTRKDAPPARLKGLDIEEHSSQLLPLGLAFTDTSGRRVTLGDYVRGERPVIFTLNYSDCPMLCSLQLSGLATALRSLDRKLGSDFDIVTVSLNPLESTERARETEQRYHGEAGQPGAAGGWHFVTGTQQNIEALAHAMGIGYGYNEERKEYVHPAALVISTPSGRISRYLYGIEYAPKTLSLSLVEAADGKIGSSVDRLILYCFHYDETEGRYAPVAMNIMRVGGGLTALCLGSFLGAYWFRGRKRQLGGGSARSSSRGTSAARGTSARLDGKGRSPLEDLRS